MWLSCERSGLGRYVVEIAPVSGIAHREPRDFGRSRQVLLEQRGRDGQHLRDIVETIGRIVGRQQTGCVDVQIQHVIDGVLVFRAIQAMHHGASRIGVRGRRLIDSRLQPGSEAVHRRRVRTRNPHRRHFARAQFPNHLFPDLGSEIFVKSRFSRTRRPSWALLWQLMQYLLTSASWAATFPAARAAACGAA